jgi:hypothetical protein
MDAFLRQTEAWAYVKSIQDAKERLLMEIAVAKALPFLAADSEYSTLRTVPVDLLIYARTVHNFLRPLDTLRRILDGTITSIDDLDPFPRRV